MNASRVDLILRQLDALPPLPAAAVRAMELTGRPGADARELVALIETDPALASGVLQLAQASNVAARGVTSLHRAIVLLGVRPIRNAVLAMGVLQALPPEGMPRHAGSADSQPLAGSDGTPTRTDFWTHSLAVACAAEMLAETMASRSHCVKPPGEPPDPADAFCCGLLHDLGKLALHAAVPKSYGRVLQAADTLRGNIADIEREVIAVDHHTAGRRLAERWRLPTMVRNVVWLHNQQPQALPETVGPDAPMILLVSLADGLARSLRLGYSGNYAFGVPQELLMAPLGLEKPDLDAVLEHLVERTSARSEALGLAAGDAGALYRRALERATGELTEAQALIRKQSRTHRARAKCFAALAELKSELHPSATVADVLATVTQTAAEALRCGSAVGFAFSADGSAETVLLERGRVTQRNRIDPLAESPALRPRRPNAPRDAAGAFLPAGNDLEWLTGLFGPNLRGSRRWWLRLESDGETIGGIVWGGEPDEPGRLEPQTEAMGAMCAGWSLALRTAQAREDASHLAEQLAESNRRLAEAQDQIARDRVALSVAELAAGAAHEMNNPLMVISGRSQLLYTKLKDDRDRQAALAIHQNAQRLSDMITQLMRFARPAAADPKPATVEAIFTQVTSLVANLPEREGRKLEWSARGLPAVLVDEAQIARAVAALVENALQATSLQEGHVEVHAAMDAMGRQVIVTVSDNGAGMDAATLRHALDPFFSHKPAGRRRGMGLPVAQRLIEANGGTLRLDSRVGAGTRAIVALPLAASGTTADDVPARRSA